MASSWVLAALVVGCQVTITDETFKYDGGGCTACGADECVDVSADPAHCGRCDRACGITEECVAGSCVEPTCVAGATECGTRLSERACVDLDSNLEHCGVCERECLSSTVSGSPVCVSGVCRAAAQGEPVYSDGDALTGGTVGVYEFGQGLSGKPLCFAGFDDAAAEVVCRFFGLVPKSYRGVTSSLEGIGELDCIGTEDVLTDCGYTFGPCPAGEIVELTCAQP